MASTGEAVDVQRLFAERRVDAVCFDVDSTVSPDESIDILAAHCGAKEKVQELTKKAMQGNVLFQDALRARLDIMNSNSATILKCLQEDPPRLSNGIAALVSALHTSGIQVYLISGGFRVFVNILATKLKIPLENVFANSILLRSTAAPSDVVVKCGDLVQFVAKYTESSVQLEYCGFDQEEFTSRSGGKAAAVKHVMEKHGHKHVVMIGDGATDLEAKPPAVAVIGYGGIVTREKVLKEADWFITDFQSLTDTVVQAQQTVQNSQI